MATKRMIHDRFFDSLDVAELTVQQRYLILGMIAHADDQGRLLADPRWLKKEIFPYDAVKPSGVQADLEAIASNGDTVILYQVGDRQYVQFANWWEYQSLQWAKPSEYPAPDGWDDRIRQLQYKPERWVRTLNWPGTDDRTAYEQPNDPPDEKPSPSPNESPNPLGDASPMFSINPNISSKDQSARAGEIFTRAETHFGGLNAEMADKINADIDDYGLIAVNDALGIAEKNDARSWHYVTTILERWQTEGRGPRDRQNGQGDVATEAWAVVTAAIKKGRADPIMARQDVLDTLNNIGGWRRVKDASEREITFIKKEFMKEYHV